MTRVLEGAGKKVKLGMVLATLSFLASGACGSSILGSGHDFPSANAVSTESDRSDMCIFCHTPHDSNPSDVPLWNKLSNAGRTFTPYSSTMGVTPGKTRGISLACLSCHDGQIGLDQLQRHPARSAGVADTSPGGPHVKGRSSKLLASGHSMPGEDLSDDHPVSFVYQQAYAADTDGLRAPTPGNPVTVRNGTHSVDLVGDNPATATIECTTCHKVHDPENESLLVMDNSPSSGTGSPLCLTCHNK